MERLLASLWGSAPLRLEELGGGGLHRGLDKTAVCRGLDTGIRPCKVTPQGGTQEIKPRVHLLPSTAHSPQKPESGRRWMGPT